MTAQTPKFFYTTDSWNETSWIDVISVEYETLVTAYPFDAKLKEISSQGRLKVLDVGCGSAIFPQYLDRNLSGGIHLTCDLLDVSARSLRQAQMVLNELEHFSAHRTIQALIEDIPDALSATDSRYELIWGIHSLTTVDLDRMTDVYRHLLRLLLPGGRIYVYQLTAGSTYQMLHELYRERLANGAPRFMEYEDTVDILDSLSVDYEVLELDFDHVLPMDRPELVENYLRKCVLDESIDTNQIFGDILPRFESDGKYRIPQQVNFVSISPS